MALQGDLSSFALPDVLRLLAGTAKSGCLEVAASTATGEVWFREGGIVGGAVSTSPHAMAPAEVVFELLRLPDGSFVFDDTEEIDDAEVTSVDQALTEAEALVAEWADVESVVPSMEAWVTFAPEIDGDVTVTATQWRTLAAIGNGGSVADLSDALEVTDLAMSRSVKDLVEHGLAGVRADHGYAAAAEPAIDAPEIDDQPMDEHAEVDDLDVLRADDRPVMMESADDALLPEPLPGAGVSYAGESVVAGAVDGRGFDAVDHESPYDHVTPPSYQPPTYAEPAYAAPAAVPAALEAAPEPAAMDDQPAHEPTADDVEDAGDEQQTGYRFVADDIPRHDFHGQGRGGFGDSSYADDPAEAFASDGHAPEAYDPLASTFGEAPVDDDRGSLLKFLSTVQP